MELEEKPSKSSSQVFCFKWGFSSQIQNSVQVLQWGMVQSPGGGVLPRGAEVHPPCLGKWGKTEGIWVKSATKTFTNKGSRAAREGQGGTVMDKTVCTQDGVCYFPYHRNHPLIKLTDELHGVVMQT